MSLLLTKRTNIDCEIEDVKLIDNFNNKIIKNAERFVRNRTNLSYFYKLLG